MPSAAARWARWTTSCAFYYGDGHLGLKPQLTKKADEINARDVNRILIGKPADGPEVYVRVGQYGPFAEQGDRRASLPDKMAPDEMTLQVAQELLDKAAKGDEPLGVCPQTGKPVFLKIGRFGPYVQRGTSDEEKPQRASLLKGIKPEERDVGVGHASFEPAPASGPAPADGPAGDGPEREIRPVCEVRQ